MAASFRKFAGRDPGAYKSIAMLKTIRRRALAAVFALLLPCCAQLKEPCSEASLAEAVAVCVARERLECEPTADGKKDTTCTAYVECRETIDKWETCE